MKTFFDLYKFIELAKNSRKYPKSTANNLKSALKIFEKSLTEDELYSVDIIEERIEEVFMGLIDNNRDKSVDSLNTYKARFLRVINDFKRYSEPSKMQNWLVKSRKSTPLVNKIDKQDKNKDKELSDVSELSHTHVHKIELCLQNGSRAEIFLPKDISPQDAKLIKNILDSLTKNN